MMYRESASNMNGKKSVVQKTGKDSRNHVRIVLRRESCVQIKQAVLIVSTLPADLYHERNLYLLKRGGGG